MNGFREALISKAKNAKIPDEYNYFGQLIGEWDFDWVEDLGTDHERHIKGEWIFSWVLEGTAIQDVFICPSREENQINPQAEAEYGTTLRIYNPPNKSWDIFYGCMGSVVNLEAKKEGSEIVLLEKLTKNLKWVFSEITQNTFHWRRIVSEDGGALWKTRIDLFATRK